MLGFIAELAAGKRKDAMQYLGELKLIDNALKRKRESGQGKKYTDVDLVICAVTLLYGNATSKWARIDATEQVLPGIGEVI